MADIGTTVRTFIAGKSGVAALVAARIYPDVLPQGYRTSQGGALVYSVISTQHDHLINGLAGVARSRIEFTTYAATRAGANAIAEAIRTCGLVGHTGAMGTMQILSVMIDGGNQTLDELPTDGGQEHRYLTIFDYQIAYSESK
jgi:hypothetical protein